jgi:hypothetical protein
MSHLIVVYWCAVCRMYHVDTFIEWVNAVPHHRTSTGELHEVSKAKSAWMN